MGTRGAANVDNGVATADDDDSQAQKRESG